MADEGGVPADLLVKRFLEGEDDEDLFGEPGQAGGAAGAGGPDLRADIVENRDLPVIGQAQDLVIEAVEVHGYHAGGPLVLEVAAHQLYQLQPEEEILEGLRETDRPHGDQVIDEMIGDFLHPHPAHGGDGDLGVLRAQGLDQIGRVQVAGRVAGHYQDILIGWCDFSHKMIENRESKVENQEGKLALVSRSSILDFRLF